MPEAMERSEQPRENINQRLFDALITLDPRRVKLMSAEQIGKVNTYRSLSLADQDSLLNDGRPSAETAQAIIAGQPGDQAKEIVLGNLLNGYSELRLATNPLRYAFYRYNGENDNTVNDNSTTTEVIDKGDTDTVEDLDLQNAIALENQQDLQEILSELSAGENQESTETDSVEPEDVDDTESGDADKVTPTKEELFRRYNKGGKFIEALKGPRTLRKQLIIWLRKYIY